MWKALLITAVCCPTFARPAPAARPASELLTDSGVRGGLVVCIGCEEPAFLASLRPNEAYLVQGLDPDGRKVAGARRSLLAKGVYGPVSVQQWDGKTLPYVDNLVNAIVIRDAGFEIPVGEVTRVLAPRGVVIGPEGCGGMPPGASPVGDGRVAFVKPVPAEIDEWTHFLHGADNNALADDTVVGPPRHVQWRSEPIWGRDHHAEKGTYPTVRTVVSSRGRLFCLLDETLSSDMKVPSQWTLVARDAFSGVLLWKRAVKTGTYPRNLEEVWRQLIADGERLYAVLGDRLAELNAVDGEVIKSYPGSEGLKEVVKAGNVLLVLREDGHLVAFQADTAERLWTWSPAEDGPVVRGTLAASGARVFVKTEKGMSCLSAVTGEPLWRVALPGPKVGSKLKFPHEKLLVSDGVVLCSYGGNDPMSLRRDAAEYLGSHPRVHEYGGKLGAFSAGDGKQLWETEYLPNLESAPGEIYISGGLVWLGPDFARPRDLHTGDVARTRPVIERLWTDGHHHRCYPGKATSRYILTAKRGIELIDMTGDGHSRNNWVRGTCRVGVTPCNGLIYAPPHSCGCYMEAKLVGFWALAARRTWNDKPPEAEARLERGKAFGEPPDARYETRPTDWWTYRGGNQRGGSTPQQVPADLQYAWKTKLGGRLSAATVAGGKVYVARVDAHTVHALDARTGRPLWAFPAGGRVDSPPTLVAGLVLFGARDGYVYCLRASDGEMVWRFLAATRHVNTVAFDQPESVWPVHGSVLLHRGVVYAAAGRSSYLDGGIMLVGLDPASGRVVVERRLESQHAGAMPPPEDANKHGLKIRQNWLDYKTTMAPDQSDSFAMRGATPDVLVADADSIYLRHVRFDRNLVEQDTKRSHLFSTSSLLDGWEHNRSYWVLGTGDFTRIPVAYPWIIRRDVQVPIGLMMAFDEKTVWSVRRGGENSIVATTRPDPTDRVNAVPDFQRRSAPEDSGNSGWRATLGIRARAMLQAGELLFFGGMPVDHRGAPASPWTPQGEGETHGCLHVVSCSNGKTLREMKLAAPPVWDGMAAAEGRLFIPCIDGSVVGLAAKPR